MDNGCPDYYGVDDGDGDGGEGSEPDDGGGDVGEGGDDGEATSIPGFGLLLSITAALGAALIATRRK
jgi:PGF-CTERM protein